MIHYSKHNYNASLLRVSLESYMTARQFGETFTKHIVKWLRLQYVQFIRLKLGHGSMPKLEDLSVLYHSDHFVVINKRHDIVVNSSEADVISVATQLQHVYPELIDQDVQFGFRLVLSMQLFDAVPVGSSFSKITKWQLVCLKRNTF